MRCILPVQYSTELMIDSISKRVEGIQARVWWENANINIRTTDTSDAIPAATKRSETYLRVFAGNKPVFPPEAQKHMKTLNRCDAIQESTRRGGYHNSRVSRSKGQCPGVVWKKECATYKFCYPDTNDREANSTPGKCEVCRLPGHINMRQRYWRQLEI